MQYEVAIDVHKELDYVLLRLRGRLSLRGNARVRESIVKAALNGARVLVDVSNLRCTQNHYLRVFPAALAAAGGWPSVRLVLFGAGAALRSALAAARIPATVPLAADFVSARALVEHRPPLVRRHRDLPMDPSAAAAGRQLVRDACADWSLPHECRETAELVATELVTNAVEHARSSSQLTVTYTGAVLHVSVRDYSASIPRPRPIDIDARRGRGLHLVAALAQNWSVDRHQDGKTIWASLAVDPPG
ncbi:MAG TPA: ATP-binding protein [Pseudonocardiaceae bacterium]|nr:ATP-binding protein [Pseudonocardiaceae bacterium]